MGNPNFSERISCEDTRRLFKALVRDELDVEQRERVKEHLLSCEPCVLALGNTIAETIDTNVMNFSRQRQGQGVHFEFVKPAIVTQKDDLLFTVRTDETSLEGWVLLYRLSNAGVLERLSVNASDSFNIA
jgi:hypothetical protein